MATVYLANDRRLDRSVALKVVRRHQTGTPDDNAAERFRAEARASARLSHPGIVAVHDQGDVGDLSYLTMEYVPGSNLRAHLRDEGPFSVGRCLTVLEEILAALSVAHEAGIVHRDVKPENVLLTRRGQVKVTDFGLARSATTAPATGGQTLGTVAYMAPEVIRSDSADPRADVYSVGILAAEMLTGVQPFRGPDAQTVAHRHLTEDLPAPSLAVPDLPRAVDVLVQELAAREPDARPPDAGHALAAVRSLRGHLSPTELAVSANRHGPDDATRPLPTVSQTAVLARGTGNAPPSHPASPDAATEIVETSQPRARRRLTTPLVVILVTVLVLAAGGALWWATAGPGALRAVPDGLAGVSSEAAVDAVSAAGLDPVVVENYDDDVAEGLVVGTDPAGGTRLAEGEEVSVIVSRGVETITVPQGLVGAPEDDVAAALEGAGLVVGEVTREYSALPEGDVVSLSADEGTELPRGTAVDLTVSRGPDMLAVPDVIGDSPEDARTVLEDAGFTVETKEFLGGLLGIVISQEPGGGDVVERGTTVTLNVT